MKKRPRGRSRLARPKSGYLGKFAATIRRGNNIKGLTTAATVWVTAALGIACALAVFTTKASIVGPETPLSIDLGTMVLPTKRDGPGSQHANLEAVLHRVYLLPGSGR
jgi:hypothetical protein